MAGHKIQFKRMMISCSNFQTIVASRRFWFDDVPLAKQFGFLFDFVLQNVTSFLVISEEVPSILFYCGYFAVVFCRQSYLFICFNQFVSEKLKMSHVDPGHILCFQVHEADTFFTFRADKDVILATPHARIIVRPVGNYIRINLLALPLDPIAFHWDHSLACFSENGRFVFKPFQAVDIDQFIIRDVKVTDLQFSAGFQPPLFPDNLKFVVAEQNSLLAFNADAIFRETPLIVLDKVHLRAAADNIDKLVCHFNGILLYLTLDLRLILLNLATEKPVECAELKEIQGKVRDAEFFEGHLYVRLEQAVHKY